MDNKSGRILYEKNADEKLYPASVTKVMTAILVLEHCSLDEKAEASYDAIMSVPSGYSKANIQVGEELTVGDLLEALLVASANDAANVLAEHVAGSVASFSTMMNTKAVELGCTGTNFVNPNGVQNDNHYTTSHDLALIGHYAMQNETFRQLVTTTTYTLPQTDAYPKSDRILNASNALIKPNNSTKPDNYYYPYAIGVKTGFTNAAKDTLIAAAAKDNMEFLVVIMNAGKTADGLSIRYPDAKNIFNYAFTNYISKDLIEKDAFVKQVKVSNGTSATKNMGTLAENTVSALVENDQANTEVSPEIAMNDNLKAPIKKGDVVGKVTYKVNDVEYSTDLLAESDVKVSTFMRNFLIILAVVIVIVTIWKYLYGEPKKKKRV